MAPTPERYRDIPQVGPELEEALHTAGHRTWADLAAADPDEIREIAGAVRPTTADQVAGWQAEAEARAHAGAPGLGGTGGEVRYSFLVTVVVDGDGRALRSSVRNVRADIGRDWQGWQPAGLTAFVETEAGVRRRASLPARRLPRIEVGTVVGGAGRTVSAEVPHELVGENERFGYVARLLARPIGTAQGAPVGVLRGEAAGDRPLRLDFGSLDLPTGVQRLELDVEVTPLQPSPGQAVGASG